MRVFPGKCEFCEENAWVFYYSWAKFSDLSSFCQNIAWVFAKNSLSLSFFLLRFFQTTKKIWPIRGPLAKEDSAIRRGAKPLFYDTFLLLFQAIVRCSRQRSFQRPVVGHAQPKDDLMHCPDTQDTSGANSCSRFEPRATDWRRVAPSGIGLSGVWRTFTWCQWGRMHQQSR